MKKVKLVLLALLAVLLIFGVVFWWFWSLGSYKPVEASQLKLAIEQGEVYLKKNGSSIEERVGSGTVLEVGDSVRTTEKARASIIAEGRSDLRLMQGTEVVITDANTSWDKGFRFNFDLVSGKTWSRVLKLLDLDSEYKGSAENVVATVRGTSFALEKDADVKLFIDKSAVTVPLSGGEAVYTPGEWSFFQSDGSIIASGNISSSTWPEKVWIDEQRDADMKFTESAKKNLLRSLEGEKTSIPIDDWRYGIMRRSERMHLAFSGEKCDLRESQYFGRRLFAIYDLVSKGKSGLAFQHLLELEKEIDKLDSENCADKEQISDSVGKMMLVLSDSEPQDKFYKLKLRIEELYINLFQRHSAEAYWAHALALDNRLEELERFDCRPDFQGSMQRALEAVEQALARQDGDFELLPRELSDEVRIDLAKKTHVQHVRLDKFLERMERCARGREGIETNDQTATSTTSTEMGSVTSTQDGDVPNEEVDLPQPLDNRDSSSETEPATQTVTDPEPQTQPQNTYDEILDLRRIELYAQPNPINVGQTANLYVKGIKTDGSEMDATPYAVFSQVGNLGVISGSQYQANSPGSVTIIARVSDNGNTYEAQASLRIVSPMILDYLQISGNGSNQVSQGDSRQLSATAHYTNGETRDVTAASTYKSSNTLAGTMSGSTFTAGMNGTGWVTVTVTYVEQGVTKQGEISFEVVPYTGYPTP